MIFVIVTIIEDMEDIIQEVIKVDEKEVNITNKLRLQAIFHLLFGTNFYFGALKAFFVIFHQSDIN